MSRKLLLVIAAIVVLVIFTLPVDDTYRNLYINVEVYKPLIGEAKIQSYSVEDAPYTLLAFPVNPTMASILGSGSLKVAVSSESRSASKILSSIYRTTSSGHTIILTKVPVSDSRLEIKLYEDNKITDEKVEYI